MSQERLAKLVQQAAQYAPLLPESLNYARNVGNFIVLPRRQGGVRLLVLPKMQLSKSHTRFENLNWSPELLKSNKLGLRSKEEKIFAAHRPTLCPEQVGGPDYYFEDGMRKVEPYFVTYRSEAKPNQFPGVEIPFREFLKKRFATIPFELLELDVSAGLIAVNCERVNLDYIIRKGDIISCTTHRHESPILDRKLEIIFEDEDVLVVDKPSSWPVHPCGNFRMNSVVYILAREKGYMDLRPIHRLDRMTSGVLILAKSSSAARRIKKMLESGDVEKKYLALVRGRFPADDLTWSSPISSHAIALNLTVDCKVKECVTKFKLLNYSTETDSSLLECQPITGRTHQIRLHLQELGYPIVNDHLYNNSNNNNDNDDHSSTSLEVTLAMKNQVLEKIRKLKSLEKPQNAYARDEEQDWHDDATVDSCSHPQVIDRAREILETRFSKHPSCLVCQEPSIPWVSGVQPGLFLHSSSYKLGEQYEFKSKQPDWAADMQPPTNS